MNVRIVPFLLDVACEYLGLLGGPAKGGIPKVVDISCDHMLASVSAVSIKGSDVCWRCPLGSFPSSSCFEAPHTFDICLDSHFPPKTSFGGLLIRVPDTQRDFDIPELDIDESRSFHTLPLNVLFIDSESPSELFTALPEDYAPLVHSTPLLHRPVVTIESSRSPRAFNPTARLADSVGITEEGVPIGDDTIHEAHINEVEGIPGPCPLLVTVLQLKLDIRRHPGRLNGRDIGTNNFGIREIVGKIAKENNGVVRRTRWEKEKLRGHSHGPQSGPCCDVEYLLDLLLLQWSEIQLSVCLQHQSVVSFQLLDCTIEAVIIDRGCEVVAFGCRCNKTKES